VQAAAILEPGAASAAGGPSTPPRACSRRSASPSMTSWAPCSARCRPPSTASHPVGLGPHFGCCLQCVSTLEEVYKDNVLSELWHYTNASNSHLSILCHSTVRCGKTA